MSATDRKAMLEPDSSDLSLSRQCKILSLSRSSTYYRPKGESQETLALMRHIDALFMERLFYGSRQMRSALALEAVPVGRHRVRRLMALMGLQAIETGRHQDLDGWSGEVAGQHLYLTALALTQI